MKQIFLLSTVIAIFSITSFAQINSEQILNDMLFIYTHKITHRNKYIFNLIFKDLLGIDITLIANVDEWPSECRCKRRGRRDEYGGRRES